MKNFEGIKANIFSWKLNKEKLETSISVFCDNCEDNNVYVIKMSHRTAQILMLNGHCRYYGFNVEIDDSVEIGCIEMQLQ